MKVGEYVRTKSNGIQKIDEEGRINLGLIRPPFHIIKEEELLKSSPNIIDLIEVGDYVNGYKVSFKDKEPVMGKFVQCDYRVLYGTTNHYRFYEEDIKSIVTKEQFEAMEYKCE